MVRDEAAERLDEARVADLSRFDYRALVLREHGRALLVEGEREGQVWRFELEDVLGIETRDSLEVCVRLFSGVGVGQGEVPVAPLGQPRSHRCSPFDWANGRCG